MMSRNSTTRRSTRRRPTESSGGRAVMWLLALVAIAGAALSVDRVLRGRSGPEGVTPAAILPPAPLAPSGQPREANVQSIAKNASLPPEPGGAAQGTSQEALAEQALAQEEVAAQGEDAGRGDGAGRPDVGGPAFDVARVEPSGEAVIAGRAAPGAKVELLRNGIVHGRAVADSSGQFAMVPPPLPPGSSELMLRTEPPSGGAWQMSRESVVVAVEGNLKEQPVVALVAPGSPSVILSKPEGPAAAASDRVVVDAVETGRGGRLYVSGRSSPRASIRLYIDDSYLGATTANAGGRFSFATVRSRGAAGGTYRVRLDEVEVTTGAVRARAEVAFTPPPQAEAAADGAAQGALQGSTQGAMQGSRVVSQGDTLWRISRLAYGDGMRYTVIYDANHGQIRNPDRIYPGQVFVIPGQR